MKVLIEEEDIQRQSMAIKYSCIGGSRRRAFPYGPKFSQFHAFFFENLAKMYVGTPTAGSARPFAGNHGSPLL